MYGWADNQVGWRVCIYVQVGRQSSGLASVYICTGGQTIKWAGECVYMYGWADNQVGWRVCIYVQVGRQSSGLASVYICTGGQTIKWAGECVVWVCHASLPRFMLSNSPALFASCVLSLQARQIAVDMQTDDDEEDVEAPKLIDEEMQFNAQWAVLKRELQKSSSKRFSVFVYGKECSGWQYY